MLSSFVYLPPIGSAKYNTFYTWSAERKLTWADFQGDIEPNAQEAAMTASSVEFGYGMKANKISWIVTAKYFPEISWSKKNKQTDYILKHEQLHFDITELYARLLRQRLKENIKTAKDYSKIKAISKQTLSEWNKEQNDYDKETNHSMNEKIQAEWNANVQERLDALSAFASK